MGKKKRKKKGAKAQTENPALQKLRKQISEAVYMEIALTGGSGNLYRATRKVKATVQNRWAERIQRLPGVKVIGTEDVIDGEDLVQVVIFRYLNETEQRPAIGTGPVRTLGVLRRAPENVSQRDFNWYTRATAGSKPFVPYYLREKKDLHPNLIDN